MMCVYRERERERGVCLLWAVSVLSLQQNIPITTSFITTNEIIVVIHLLLHHLVKFCCNSYLKTDNLLHQNQ